MNVRLELTNVTKMPLVTINRGHIYADVKVRVSDYFCSSVKFYLIHSCHILVSGYMGNGFLCKDVDECILSGFHKCHDDANCVNNDGSYDCECKTGFHGDGYINCFYDELCQIKKCHENANCESFEGFAVCTCKEGFLGDGDYLCSPVCPTGYRQGFMDLFHGRESFFGISIESILLGSCPMIPV